jgi:seryl-tRNA(Sec) selenium transferase
MVEIFQAHQQIARGSLTFISSVLRFFGMANAKKKKSRGKAVMLGVGLDSDGHKRITTGPNFALVGGSEETHEAMTEKVIKINEKLSAKGKQLEEVSREEFDDIAHAVGLKRPNSN